MACDGGAGVGPRTVIGVVLEHDRRRRDVAQPRVGEELPFPALDVDLHQVGPGQEGKHVAHRDFAGIGAQQRCLLQEGEHPAHPPVQLLERALVGRRGSGQMEAALKRLPPVAHARAGLDDLPALGQAVGLDASPEHGGVALVGLKRRDRRIWVAAEGEQAEEAHVAAEVEDPDRTRQLLDGRAHRRRRLVDSQAEHLLQNPHVQQRVADLGQEPRGPEPVRADGRDVAKLAEKETHRIANARSCAHRAADTLRMKTAGQSRQGGKSTSAGERAEP